MKNLLLLSLLLLSFNIKSQSSEGFLKGYGAGFDPTPTLNWSKVKGADLNARIFWGDFKKEYGLAIEYMPSIQYLEPSIFKDFILTKENSNLELLIGLEVGAVFRWNEHRLKWKTGKTFIGGTAGINGRIRYFITNNIAIEGVTNFKHRGDKLRLWKEKSFFKNTLLSGRLNLVIILNEK